MDWFSEYLYKAVCVFALAISLVFTFHFLAEKRFTWFVVFALLSLAFVGLAFRVFVRGNHHDHGD